MGQYISFFLLSSSICFGYSFCLQLLGTRFREISQTSNLTTCSFRDASRITNSLAWIQWLYLTPPSLFMFLLELEHRLLSHVHGFEYLGCPAVFSSSLSNFAEVLELLSATTHNRIFEIMLRYVIRQERQFT